MGLGDIIIKVIEALARWARSRSIWMLHYCSACGAVEFPMLVMSPLDWERYGYMPAPTPRQSDIFIGMGYLTKKTVKLVLNMYRQMPEPRYVAAGCNCTATGGLYWDSYATYKRLDEFVEVEGWVPGCMPMPDDYLSLIEYLRNRIGESDQAKVISRIKPEAFNKIATYEELEKRFLKEYMEKLAASSQKPIDYQFNSTFPECYERIEKSKICKTSIERDRLRDAVKYYLEKGYKILVNINAVDYPEKNVIEIYYIFENPYSGEQIWIKTFVPRANPEIDTIHDLTPLAFYIEKEVYEMMGIVFKGHPDLRKWILDGNWEGPPPLRKDVNTADFVVKVMYNGYRYGR